LTGAPTEGELFERRYELGGTGVELLAEVEIDGTALHLKDIAIFPSGTGRARVGTAAVLRALRAELLAELGALGYTSVRITGTRLSGSSPGRSLDVTISIPQEPS